MTLLRLVSLGVLVSMVSVTVIASGDRGLFEAGSALWPDPWFRATLADAYFGFLFAYLWIAWREPTWPRRVLWFVLVMTLGTIAVSVYLLIRLWMLPRGASVRDLLLRPAPGR